LILDPGQIGLVLALSSRIHVVVIGDDTGAPQQGLVHITSPQFFDAEWRYKCTVDEEGTFHLEDVSDNL
jgi:phosphomevalonate kinase